MELHAVSLDDQITRIDLVGHMDGAGTQAIDHEFTALTSARKGYVLVDLSAVDFLASLGVRTLVTNARAQRSRGGLMVLACPRPLVRQVLDSAGVDTVVSIYPDLDAGRQALRNAAANG